jgi:hypothetical protein
VTDTADDVTACIAAAVRARSRRGMSDVDCDRLRTALTVPCDERLGCAAEPGVECRNLMDGGSTRWGFHRVRGAAAGLTWAPTTEYERHTPLPAPRRASRADMPEHAETAAADDQGWRR